MVKFRHNPSNNVENRKHLSRT